MEMNDVGLNHSKWTLGGSEKEVLNQTHNRQSFDVYTVTIELQEKRFWRVWMGQKPKGNSP